MRSIDSYDSRYPSEYYEIGTIYSFYGTNSRGNLKPAKAEYISKYSADLLELQEEEKTSAIQSVQSSDYNSSSKSLQRFYGIVVDKPRKDIIKVMLISVQDGVSDFFTKDYTVSSIGCLSDGKELMPVSPTAKYEYADKNNVKKVGGITRESSSSKVGGITRVKQSPKSAFGIGGITRSNNGSDSAPKISKADNVTNPNSKGGITRVKNVGGITRVKK